MLSNLLYDAVYSVYLVDTYREIDRKTQKHRNTAREDREHRETERDRKSEKEKMMGSENRRMWCDKRKEQLSIVKVDKKGTNDNAL